MADKDTETKPADTATTKSTKPAAPPEAGAPAAKPVGPEASKPDEKLESTDAADKQAATNKQNEAAQEKSLEQRLAELDEAKEKQKKAIDVKGTATAGDLWLAIKQRKEERNVVKNLTKTLVEEEKANNPDAHALFKSDEDIIKDLRKRSAKEEKANNPDAGSKSDKDVLVTDTSTANLTQDLPQEYNFEALLTEMTDETPSEDNKVLEVAEKIVEQGWGDAFLNDVDIAGAKKEPGEFGPKTKEEDIQEKVADRVKATMKNVADEEKSAKTELEEANKPKIDSGAEQEKGHEHKL